MQSPTHLILSSFGNITIKKLPAHPSLCLWVIGINGVFCIEVIFQAETTLLVKQSSVVVP